MGALLGSGGSVCALIFLVVAFKVLVKRSWLLIRRLSPQIEENGEGFVGRREYFLAFHLSVRKNSWDWPDWRIPTYFGSFPILHPLALIVRTEDGILLLTWSGNFPVDPIMNFIELVGASCYHWVLMVLLLVHHGLLIGGCLGPLLEGIVRGSLPKVGETWVLRTFISTVVWSVDCDGDVFGDLVGGRLLSLFISGSLGERVFSIWLH